uniref:RNA-binding protein 48 n=1 Tax=Cucumis melo TaxID=3656 RepID=A0A9I9CZ73_CUCME
MPRFRDEPLAVRAYTVCDESRYLIVRNVPALGCGDGLHKLFSSYGNLEECKPMDAEECDEFTDVYFVKFHSVTNARPRGSAVSSTTAKLTNPSRSNYTLEQKNSLENRNYGDAALISSPHVSQMTRVSSDQYRITSHPNL